MNPLDARGIGRPPPTAGNAQALGAAGMPEGKTAQADRNAQMGLEGFRYPMRQQQGGPAGVCRALRVKKEGVSC